LLNIHNRCKDITLTSPVHFTHGGRWNVTPDQKIDVDSVMRNHLELDFERNRLEGTLIYKIQWRQCAESDEFIQDESKSIQLLVAWCVDYTKGLDIRASLVEHDKDFNWDEDKLRGLHQKYWHLLDAQINPIGCNWLLNDRVVLETAIKVMNGGCKWDVFIAEGIKNKLERPLWIDTTR
jgi:hypothetical protein